MKTEPTYVGIDVAKDWVDVFIRPTGHSWSVNFVEAEVDEFVAKLQAIEPTVAIVEATGGLELPLVAALDAASLPVAVVNPRQVRDFPSPPASWPRKTGWTRSWHTSVRPSGQR